MKAGRSHGKENARLFLADDTLLYLYRRSPRFFS